MEREGIISKYVALLDKNKIDKGFVVFCNVKLVQHNVDSVTTFEKEVIKLKSEIEVLASTNSAQMWLKDITALEKKLAE